MDAIADLAVAVPSLDLLGISATKRPTVIV
jgi:hypothetical protein